MPILKKNDELNDIITGLKYICDNDETCNALKNLTPLNGEIIIGKYINKVSNDIQNILRNINNVVSNLREINDNIDVAESNYGGVDELPDIIADSAINSFNYGSGLNRIGYNDFKSNINNLDRIQGRNLRSEEEMREAYSSYVSSIASRNANETNSSPIPTLGSLGAMGATLGSTTHSDKSSSIINPIVEPTTQQQNPTSEIPKLRTISRTKVESTTNQQQNPTNGTTESGSTSGPRVEPTTQQQNPTSEIPKSRTISRTKVEPTTNQQQNPTNGTTESGSTSGPRVEPTESGSTSGPRVEPTANQQQNPTNGNHNASDIQIVIDGGTKYINKYLSNNNIPISSVIDSEEIQLKLQQLLLNKGYTVDQIKNIFIELFNISKIFI